MHKLIFKYETESLYLTWNAPKKKVDFYREPRKRFDFRGLPDDADVEA